MKTKKIKRAAKKYIIKEYGRPYTTTNIKSFIAGAEFMKKHYEANEIKLVKNKKPQWIIDFDNSNKKIFQDIEDYCLLEYENAVIEKANEILKKHEGN